MQDVPQLWTINAAAAELGLKPCAIRTAITRGELESFLLGGAYHITNDAVVAFLEKMKNQKSNCGRKPNNEK